MAETSPYLLQALAGQQGLLQDPQIVALQPRMQLAQSLMQQGTSDAPVYGRAGVLSHLANALLGGYLLNDNMSKLQGIQSQREQQATALADSLNGSLLPPQTQAAAPSGSAAPAPQASPAAAQPPTPGTNLPTGNPAITNAIHQNESGGSMQPGITGDNGAAAGPMQVHQAALDDVNRATGNNYTLAQVQADPMLGLRVGQAYQHILEQRFPGRPDLVMAAYNAGPTATQTAVNSGAGISGLPSSTQAYVAKGEAALQPTQVAGPGAPTGNSPAPAPGAQPQGQPQQVGPQNPNIQHYLETIQHAQAAMLANPYNPLVQKAAQMAINNAQMLMGMDIYQTNPNGTQTNLRTGQIANAPAPNAHYQETAPGVYTDSTGTHAPTFAPAPRPFTDVHGNTGAVGPGGAMTPLALNPSGITGNTPEANSMRVIAEVGPKIANGTATDQDRASYNTAVTTFQHYQTQTNPADKNLITTPTVPLPVGMPQPQGGGTSVPLTVGSPRGQEVTQNVTQSQADADTKAIADQQAQIMQGHNMLGTTATIRSTLPNVTTGQGADARLLSSQIGAAMGISPDSMQKYVGTNPVMGELLQKKLFELSTGAVRGMGAREPGSVMQMFQKNYPNMTSQNMTIDAMTRLLDMDQTYKEDEVNARRDYLNNDLATVKNGGSYQGLSGYTPPDPKLYQAAALASGGLPYANWSQGLSPQQQTQALRLAARVYPDATVLDSKGVKHTFQQPQQANAH